MRAAGIRTFSGPVEQLELAEPAVPRPDEVLIDVHSSGVGNWDDIARAGGWDLGRRPPMALAAAGVVATAGQWAGRELAHPGRGRPTCWTRGQRSGPARSGR